MHFVSFAILFFIAGSLYAQDSIKHLVKDRRVPANWTQLLVSKKSWKPIGTIEVRGDKVKDPYLEYGRTEMLFTADSLKYRPAVNNVITDFKAEYFPEHKYVFVSSGYYAFKVYAMDSSYLVVEWMQDLSEFLNETNYQSKAAATPGSDAVTFQLKKPIGSRRIDLNLGRKDRKILTIYRAY